MPILLEASHATQLPLTGEPLAWIHVLPMGDFRGRDGRGPYVVRSAQAVIDETLAYAAGADLVVDYEHQTLTAKDHSGPVPAAGWLREFEAREDGIWGRVEWTPTASSALVAKEYRYFSPVFDYNPRTGEVARMKLGALTNVPNLQLQAAASRQGDFMDELMERLCYLLNLPLTTTREEMKAQLDKLKGLLDQAASAAAASAELAKAVGLDSASALPAIVTAVQSRLAQAPDPAQYVPMAQYDQVANSLADLQKVTQGAEVERLVTEAMTAGKVPPALKDWAMDYASRDRDGFKKYVDGAPVITGDSHMREVPPAGGAKALTPEEETVAHAMGLSPEIYLAAKKEV